MNKEEILAKSRMENKEKDIADIEAEKNASAFAMIFGAIFALVLYFAQRLTGNGLNYSIWALMTVMTSALNFHKYYSLKKRKNLICGILWTFTSVLVIIMTINSFIG